MKNTMSVVRIPFQVVVALGLLAILIIEIFRPFTNIPDNVFVPKTIEGTPYEIWPPFVAQFAYFTTWTNVLFVFTIVAAWVFRSKINPYWKNAVATYLMVMLVVFFTVLLPYVDWQRSPWLSFLLIWNHLAVVVIGLWWFFTTKTETKTNLGQSVLITLIVPILYFVLVITTYALSHVAPYIFFDFMNFFKLDLDLPWSILLSILTIIVIALLFVGFNCLFVLFTNNNKAMSVKRGKKGFKKKMTNLYRRIPIYRKKTKAKSHIKKGHPHKKRTALAKHHETKSVKIKPKSVSTTTKNGDKMIQNKTVCVETITEIPVINKKEVSKKRK